MAKVPAKYQSTFDYEGLDPATKGRLLEEADNIRQKYREVETGSLELAAMLDGMKPHLHGRWLAWVEQECGISGRLAQMLVNAHSYCLAHADIHKLIPASALYALSAPQLDEGVREKVTETIRTDEHCRSVQAVKERISEETKLLIGKEPSISRDASYAALDAIVAILLKHVPKKRQVEMANFFKALKGRDFPKIAKQLAAEKDA
jgi:hypothetical protein